tara:strand:- start:3995 stop:4480 length:486 start_codon:yes stop_codon:yes gene_type:complete
MKLQTEECLYEYYTIHTDSLQTTNGNTFVNHLVYPLKNVLKVEIISASFDLIDRTSSNVAYLRVRELDSRFNDVSGVVDGNGISAVSTLRSSLARFHVNSGGRTEFKGNDFCTTTYYLDPIKTITRLSIELLDEAGNSLVTTPNTYITYKFTCVRQNLCGY